MIRIEDLKRGDKIKPYPYEYVVTVLGTVRTTDGAPVLITSVFETDPYDTALSWTQDDLKDVVRVDPYDGFVVGAKVRVGAAVDDREIVAAQRHPDLGLVVVVVFDKVDVLAYAEKGTGAYNLDRLTLVKDPTEGFVVGARVLHGVNTKIPGVIKSRFESKLYGPVAIVECDDGRILTLATKNADGSFPYLELVKEQGK